MSRREAGLSALAAKVRKAHLEVANPSDLERARQRFAAVTDGQASGGRRRPRAATLLLAASLATAIAGAAVLSSRKGPASQPLALSSPEPAVTGMPPRTIAAPALAPSLGRTQVLEESASPTAEVPTSRKPLLVPPSSSDVPLSALPPTLQKERLLAERRAAPGSAAATSAAFRLGRVEADYLGNPAAAAKWFATYLAEQPRGPLRGDARGRLFDCLWQSGQKAAAQAQAQRYLLDFPGGPHATRARHILSQ